MKEVDLMPIPKNIKRKHILQAVDYINEYGTPDERKSTRFHLIYEKKPYCPKYVVSVANIFANGEELAPSKFSGGKETNSFLAKLGFQIAPIEVNEKASHSWTVVSPKVAIKVMDKSALLHNGIGIPIDIRVFFDVEELGKGQNQKVTLIYEDKQYIGNIEFDKMNNPRSRLLWSSSLSGEIRKNFEGELINLEKGEIYSSLKMKFVKHSNLEFEIVIASEFKFSGTKLELGEFDYSIYNKSEAGREYMIGKETRYYILTVKLTDNIAPPYQTYSYKVYVLDNHEVVASTVVRDRVNKNLLTPAKEIGVKLLLEYNQKAIPEESSLVHYKQDRPNGYAWQKDSFNVVSGLFNKYKKKTTDIEIEIVEQDLESEKAEEDTYYSDGTAIKYFGKRYERNPNNRKVAIEIHGTSCAACGFNFENAYGEHGKDFIEIHHVKPLFTLEQEVEINPIEDLVPLCANCHRMVHRKKDSVLSLEQLKGLINNRIK